MDEITYKHKMAEINFLENMRQSEGLSTLTAATINNRLEQLKKEMIKKPDVNNIHEEDVSFTGRFSGGIT